MAILHWPAPSEKNAGFPDRTPPEGPTCLHPALVRITAACIGVKLMGIRAPMEFIAAFLPRAAQRSAHPWEPSCWTEVNRLERRLRGIWEAPGPFED